MFDFTGQVIAITGASSGRIRQEPTLQEQE